MGGGSPIVDPDALKTLFASQEWAWVSRKLTARYISELQGMQSLANPSLYEVGRSAGRVDILQEIQSLAWSRGLVEELKEENKEKE